MRNILIAAVHQSRKRYLRTCPDWSALGTQKFIKDRRFS